MDCAEQPLDCETQKQQRTDTLPWRSKVSMPGQLLDCKPQWHHAHSNYSIVLYSILPCSPLLCSILFFSILFYSIPFCSVLLYPMLFYSILFSSNSILLYSTFLCPPLLLCSTLFSALYSLFSTLYSALSTLYSLLSTPFRSTVLKSPFQACSLLCNVVDLLEPLARRRLSPKHPLKDSLLHCADFVGKLEHWLSFSDI